MIDPLLHILDWLVENKVIGIPVASVIVIAVAVFSYLWRRRGDEGGAMRAERGGKVQQTTVKGIRAKGDVEISPRQE
jgi:ribose/xylose/arabinose/galactoside ABC-type transport system permease subunit